MVAVVISIGSNCGKREELVKEAIEWLKSILFQFSESEVYETPCAKLSGKPYMNAVVEGFYQGDGINLEDLIKEKEHNMGRTAECRQRGDVPIDMDIVIMNGDIVKPWDYRQRFFQLGFSQLQNA